MPEATLRVGNIKELKVGEHRLVVDPHGMMIRELALNGTVILGSGTRVDGREFATHPCTPIFGPDTSAYQFPQHGTGRASEWQPVSSDGNRLSFQFVVQHPGYPAITVVQDHVLSPEGVYTLTTTHRNDTLEAAPVNFGEHCYFTTPQGWQGATLNGQRLQEAIGEANHGVTTLQTPNKILLPGQPPIKLDVEGFGYGVIWSMGHPETGVRDSHYVCIEPVEGEPGSFFGSQESMITPGTERRAVMRLSVLPNE